MKEKNNPNNSVYSSAQKAPLREGLGEASSPSLRGRAGERQSPLLRGGDRGRLLTIIIPTYNMEKYLRHCLDSLIVPNMDKVEVLVINDGSKDSSSAIAHEYQDKYPQTFRVIDKENGNYGSCINRGLKEATGKYIKVLDADDSFDNLAFKEFIDELQNIDADLVLTDFSIVDEQDNITETYIYSEHNKKIPVRERFNFVEYINRPYVIFHGQMHGFTYRTEMIKNMGYHQTEGISYTDQEWVFKPIIGVKTCEYVNINLYKYLVGRAGQTMANVGKSIKQIMTVIFSLVNYYIEQKRNTPYRKYLVHQLEDQMDQIYRRCLLDGSYSIAILRDFDNALSKYLDVYHLVDDFGVIRDHPFGLKYIKYWRKYKASKLPYRFKIVNRLKSFIRK